MMIHSISRLPYYFKIHKEHHNLDRARNQFKLVADIAGKEEMLGEIVRQACAGII